MILSFRHKETNEEIMEQRGLGGHRRGAGVVGEGGGSKGQGPEGAASRRPLRMRKARRKNSKDSTQQHNVRNTGILLKSFLGERVRRDKKKK